MKLLIGAKQLQKFLQLKGFYSGKIDGAFGPKSQQAALDYVVSELGPNGWNVERSAVAAVQLLFVELDLQPGSVDGYVGPNTLRALEDYQNLLRGVPASDEEIAQSSTVWPRYKDMEKFYGPVGQNIERYKSPYVMKLAWDTDTTVSKLSLNKRCGTSAIGVMEEARDHYGVKGIRELRLDLFGGSLNVRKMRGGSSYSVHSWAAAIDFDPSHNQFRWNDSRATLDEKEYDFWWKLWEAAGWVSLGRERNYDWMHVQACRL